MSISSKIGSALAGALAIHLLAAAPLIADDVLEVVGEPVAVGSEQQDREGASVEILLVREVPINRDERVKAPCQGGE
jgi:hypothetical protein